MKILKIVLIMLLMLLYNKANALFLQYINPKNPYYGLSHEFLIGLTQSFTIPNFIETGTFLGCTTEIAQQYFANVHTLELSREHYFFAYKKLSHLNHVHLHFGDSGRILHTILPKTNGLSLFWLDAHYSGSGTAFTGCGTPIIEELVAIKATGNINDFIMIDDIRLFDLIPQRASVDAGQGFPDLTEIYAKLMEINPNFSLALLGDTLMAFDSSKNITLSSVVHACTQSRLSKCLNLADEDVQLLELNILNAQEPEKSTFKALHDVYCHADSNTPSPYYHVWFGLTLMADGHYLQAAHQFERAIALDFNPPRIQAYLAHAQQQYAAYIQEQNMRYEQEQVMIRRLLPKQNILKRAQTLSMQQTISCGEPIESELII